MGEGRAPGGASGAPAGGAPPTLVLLNAEIVRCRACPRLVEHRERVACEKRRAFRDHAYWGRPLPGFGDARARLLLLGLAPAAHGGNRTGRMFTGDRSGDFLYSALHRAGLASQPTAVSRDDGLRLRGCYITAAVRCAPPQNRPLPDEIGRCGAFLSRELDLLPDVRAVLCLGGLAFRAALDLARRRGYALPRPLPAFRHGLEIRLQPGVRSAASPDAPATRSARGPGAPRGERALGAPSRGAGSGRGATAPMAILCSYHPSQQNTFTGRLTPAMLDAVLERARGVIEGARSVPGPPGAGRVRGRRARGRTLPERATAGARPGPRRSRAAGGALRKRAAAEVRSSARRPRSEGR